jgi:hypothetical protein
VCVCVRERERDTASPDRATSCFEGAPAGDAWGCGGISGKEVDLEGSGLPWLPISFSIFFSRQPQFASDESTGRNTYWFERPLVCVLLRQ